jgi:hypothetical protein
MSKRKNSRNDQGQYAKAPAMWSVGASWIFAVLSLGLLWFSAAAVSSDFGSFRSCSSNNVLTVSNCGKQSINFGDIALIGLLVLAAFFTLSICTHTWRVTRRLFT